MAGQFAAAAAAARGSSTQCRSVGKGPPPLNLPLARWEIMDTIALKLPYYPTILKCLIQMLLKLAANRLLLIHFLLSWIILPWAQSSEKVSTLSLSLSTHLGNANSCEEPWGRRKAFTGCGKIFPSTYVSVLSTALIQLAFLSRFGLLSCIGKL